MPQPNDKPANPGLLTAGEVAEHVMTAAVRAPSVHNIQLWRFTASGQQISLHADDGRRAALATAIQEVERAQRRDGDRVAELARWAPAPDSARADGVPPTAYPARAEHSGSGRGAEHLGGSHV